jgi:hypothetical protein
LDLPAPAAALQRQVYPQSRLTQLLALVVIL